MIYDMIIAGSGPAGLSAGVYAVRAGLNILILEKDLFQGGQITKTGEISNYLGLYRETGLDIAEKFKDHAHQAGVQVKTTRGITKMLIKPDTNIKLLKTENGETFETKTVVIATGAVPRMLGIPGEKEFIGRGVSYCATCDGAFFGNKKVAVIGGGDTAVEDALYLANICKEVHIIHRRNQLRAAKSFQTMLEKCKNVTFEWNCTANSISQEHDNIKKLALEYLDGKEPSDLYVDGIFIAIGTKPNSEPFRDIVPCDKNGYIITDAECRTGVDGIYAAGDVRTTQLRQVITAVADGAIAVHSAEQYLMHI